MTASTTSCSTTSARISRSQTTDIDQHGEHFGATGIDDPFEGLTWGFNGPDSADNQSSSSSFVSTSGILSPDEYPQFESWPSSRWDKPGGPFDPHSGEAYVYSQIADVTYKRLTREIPVPAAGGDLTFWTSYDTEEAWDHLFVEARTAGGNDWTTLPDENGHTTQDTGRQLSRGVAGAASAPRSLPDTQRRRNMHANRHLR